MSFWEFLGFCLFCYIVYRIFLKDEEIEPRENNKPRDNKPKNNKDIRKIYTQSTVDFHDKKEYKEVKAQVPEDKNIGFSDLGTRKRKQDIEFIKKEFDINKIDIRSIDPDHLDGYLMEEKKAILEKYYREVKIFPAHNIEYIKNIERRCSRDGGILFKADTFYKNNPYKEILCCQKCKTIYMVTRQDAVVDFTNGSKYLYIVKSCDCSKEGHHIVCVEGLVNDINLRRKIISVNYCYECRRYFITYDKYEALKRENGKCILANLKSVKFLSDNFDLESPLYLCGYNVSQQNALKDEDRHRILSFVIDVGILTLKDVESYITTFINLRKNRATMDIAISKWKKDLGWLHSNYGNKYNVVKHKKYIK